MNSIRPIRSALLFVTIATTQTFAMEWSYLVGVHDYIVPDVDSHTLGINCTMLGDHTTAAGTHFSGALDLFLDNDKDHLDPDHIPVWWKLKFQAKHQFHRVSPHVSFAGLFDLNTKVNTVSSVERQIKALPGIAAEYEAGAFRASLKASAGYYFLEIDDDVAKTRGYDRDDYRNSTTAFAVMADTSFALGDSIRLSASVQQWHDGDTWLENQFTAALRFDTDHWRAHSELVLGVELTEYNLDLYFPSALGNPPTQPYLPILPWDDDVFVRLSFTTSW